MAGEIENLIISASVLDDFSDTLDEFEQDLYKLEGAAESIFPIDAEMRIGEALRDIAKLKAAMAAIDDDVDIEAEMGSLLHGEAGALNLFDQPGGQIGRRDALGIFQGERDYDFDNAQWRRLMFGAGAAGLDLADLPAFGVGGPMGMTRDRESPITEVVRDFANLRLRMGQFMTLMANLFPILGVFIGALPAAIAGVGALGAAALAAAGALYGVLGLGIMGLATTGGEWDFDRLRQQVQGLIDEFLMAFSPLADAFVPIMEEGITMLSQLFYDVARNAHLALSLTDDLRWIMQFVADAAPGATAGLSAFAEAAMPIMRFMVNRLAAVEWFELFAGVLGETWPVMVSLTASLVRMAPAVFRLSLAFLQIANIIVSALGIFLRFLDWIPFGIELFGGLVAALLTALTVTGLYTLATSNLAGVLGTLVLRALPPVAAAIYEVIAAKVSATVATWAYYLSVAALLGLLTLGLVPVISSVTTGFGLMGDNITQATRALKQFRREGQRVSGFSPGASASGRGGPRYSRPGSATVVAPDKETGNAVANRLSFGERTSSTTSQSDVNNNLHSG
jgi:hypothetical protein